MPKVNPPNTIEEDVRPISLTPIASKTLESIILNMVNEKIAENIKRNQFGGMGHSREKKKRAAKHKMERCV